MKYCEAFRKDEEKWKTDQHVIPCQVQFHSTRRDWPNAGEGRGNRLKELAGTGQGHDTTAKGGHGWHRAVVGFSVVTFSFCFVFQVGVTKAFMLSTVICVRGKH